MAAQEDLGALLSSPGTGMDSGERAGVAVNRTLSNLPSAVKEAPRAERQTFPFWKTLIVSLPQFSMSSITMLLSIHLLNFFLRLGAPTATLTLVITIARSIDLLSDPALGWATDANIFRCCGPCRFPKGVRRKPFMLLGTPLYDIFLILLLGTPVDLEGNGWALSYGIFNILLYLADTTAHVPYNALLPGLSADPKAREGIFSFARIINSLGVMAAALAPVPLGIFLRPSDCATTIAACTVCPFQVPPNSTLSDICPEIDAGLPLSPGCACLQGCQGQCSLLGERAGFRVMGFIFAGWHLVTMILVIIFIQEPREKELGITRGLRCCYTEENLEAIARAEAARPASSSKRPSFGSKVSPAGGAPAPPSSSAPSPALTSPAVGTAKASGGANHGGHGVEHPATATRGRPSASPFDSCDRSTGSETSLAGLDTTNVTRRAGRGGKAGAAVEAGSADESSKKAKSEKKAKKEKKRGRKRSKEDVLAGTEATENPVAGAMAASQRASGVPAGSGAAFVPATASAGAAPPARAMGTRSAWTLEDHHVSPPPGTAAAAGAPRPSAGDGSVREFDMELDTEPDIDPADLIEPIVASINKTFRNKAFNSLIVPWLLDMASVSLLGSMLTLYVTYAVRPTDPLAVPECGGDGIRTVFGITSGIWCSSDSVWLGLGLLALMLGQVVCVPVWRCVSDPFGTRNTWLVFNLLSAVTTGLFIFGGVGSPVLTVILSLVNGIPMAAMFLNDAIVSQVIDYDANLQGGERAEARFMLFQSFIPKIISIPASVLPLSALAAIGFVSPVNGIPQPQSAIVTNYIQAVFFGLPTILSLCSFWYKLSFPLRYDEQLDRIAYNNDVLTGNAGGGHAAKAWLRDPLDPSLASKQSRSAPMCAWIFACCSGNGGLSPEEAAVKRSRVAASRERNSKARSRFRNAGARVSRQARLEDGAPRSRDELLADLALEAAAVASARRRNPSGAAAGELRAGETPDLTDAVSPIARTGPAPGMRAEASGPERSPSARAAAGGAGNAGGPSAGHGRRVSLSEEDRLRRTQIAQRQEHDRAMPSSGRARPGDDVPRLSVYERVDLTVSDRLAFFIFDHFSLQELGLWSRFGRKFLDDQVRATRRRLMLYVFLLAFGAVVQVGTGMISNTGLSWVPTITMLSFGLCLGLLVMTHMKVQASADLRKPLCRQNNRLERWTKFNAMALQLDCLELELVPNDEPAKVAGAAEHGATIAAPSGASPEEPAV